MTTKCEVVSGNTWSETRISDSPTSRPQKQRPQETLRWDSACAMLRWQGLGGGADVQGLGLMASGFYY